MQDKKPKRPRIQTIKKPLEDIEVIADELEYRQNACSPNARFIVNFKDEFTNEFWIDKHYVIRDLERVGIGLDIVKELVSKSFIHLHYYSSKHNFIFINHPPKKQRSIRVVIQKVYPKAEKLNVVVEYHFIKLNIIEVTVVTAMCKDDYIPFDGQHAIEFHEDLSVLYFNESKKTHEIDNYSE